MAGANRPVPAALAGFVGRVAELEQLRALLAAARLITLSGPGGVGKSRLALQAAAAAAAGYADGLVVVPLAPIRDPGLVAAAVAQALGVWERPDQPLLGTLRAALRPKHLLLLLDNFEQVLPAAPVVADLVAACPGLTVLLTSRAPLHLPEEAVFAVPPLARPEPAPLPPLARLAAYDAVALFVARARAARPAFHLTTQNAPAVAELCRRLDGLPLAIELAAARCGRLSPREVLAGLDRRLSLAAGDDLALPARQRTLRATIAWSEDLLPDDARALFRRLAVFAGGFTPAAVEELVAPRAGPPGAACLAALLDHSLLQCLELDAGGTRYAMLETIRELAQERLADSGEEDAVRRRHAHYFAALATEAAAHLTGAARGPWLDRLRREGDNLRAAFEWGLSQTGDARLALRLAAALRWAWVFTGTAAEGRRWLERALAGGAVEGGDPEVARALLVAGQLAWTLGEHAAARPALERSLAMWRELGDRAGIADALDFLGRLRMSQGEDEQAGPLLEESLALRRETGDPWQLGQALLALGHLAFRRGDSALGEARFEAVVALQRAAGDGAFLAQALSDLGDVARRQGDDRRAAALYEEALALCRDLELRGQRASLLQNLGHLALHRGDADAATGLFREGLALFREQGDRRGVAECLAGLGGAIALAGRPAAGARLFGAATALLDAIGAAMWPPNVPEFERQVAAARTQLGDAAFHSSWAAGRALSPEQAIREAMPPAPATTA